MIFRSCFKCANYIIREGRLGYCKIFDDIIYARSVQQLCGPTAKSFAPSSNIGEIRLHLLATTGGVKKEMRI